MSGIRGSRRPLTPVQRSHGDAPRMPGYLRLGSYRGREQAKRSGDGGDKHAYTHHCSHQGGELRARHQRSSEWIVLAGAGRPH